MVLSSFLGFSSFGSSFYTAARISINAKINLGRGETCSLFLLLFSSPLGAPVWNHPATFFLSSCDLPVWAHSSRLWLSENHGLGLLCAVPVPQYFTRLPLLSCHLLHEELNFFFLTFIWQVFSQQTVRHNWFADIPLLSWFEWIRWIRGKNANHSCMPACAPGVCNVSMCWTRPSAGKGWG